MSRIDYKRELLIRYMTAYQDLKPKEMIRIMKEWQEKWPEQSFRQAYNTFLREENNKLAAQRETDEKMDCEDDYWPELCR